MCLAGWVSSVASAEIQHTAIEKNGGRYSAIVEASIDAPLSRVFAVLTDYDGFGRIHDSIVESHRLEATQSGRERVYIEARFCVLLICFGLEQTSQFWSPGAGEVRAEVEPTASDFRYGDFRWYLTKEATGKTRLDFSGEVEPTAWIPPVIGPWYLKRKLPGMAGRIADNVERLATETTQ